MRRKVVKAQKRKIRNYNLSLIKGNWHPGWKQMRHRVKNSKCSGTRRVT